MQFSRRVACRACDQMEVAEENKIHVLYPVHFSTILAKGCYEYIIQESVMASWTQSRLMEQRKAVEFRMR
jgi:hypothetical protein